jgi:hypothetical protein
MRKTSSLIVAALLLAAPPAAPAQSDPANPEAAFADLRAMVERLRTELFAPGARVPGWDRGGANPDAELRAAGADSHFFAISDSSGQGVAILSARPIASFAPASWRVVDTYGSSATRLGNPAIGFEALSARYVIAVRANSRRSNDVDCVEPIANATLYEIPDAPRARDDEAIPIMFRVLLLAVEGRTICTRYDGSRAAGWRGRVFDTEGHSLPALDDARERITIIPAGPIERLVSYAPVTDS